MSSIAQLFISISINSVNNEQVATDRRLFLKDLREETLILTCKMFENRTEVGQNCEGEKL